MRHGLGEGEQPSPTEWEEKGYELQVRKARLRKDRKRERNVKRYKFDNEGHEKIKIRDCKTS